MSSSEVIASIAAFLSLVSIGVSLWAVSRASRFSNYQLRLSNRTELHKILLEIDRELLHDPSLDAMFKSRSAPLPPSTEPFEIIKQSNYVLMYFSMFELAFAQFNEIKGLSSTEQEVWEAWNRNMKDFFNDCLRAREMWTRYRDGYYLSFQNHIDRLVARLDAAENS